MPSSSRKHEERFILAYPMRTTLTILVLSFVLLNGSHAYADSASAHGKMVTLADSALGESHYAACAPLTLFFANTFPHEQPILVDIELRNASSTLIEQEFFDHYLVPSTKKGGQIVALTNHCSMNLTEGTYTYSVGLFTPGWGELLHWYDGVASFQAQPFSISRK
jgi:hypothetical protein